MNQALLLILLAFGGGFAGAGWIDQRGENPEAYLNWSASQARQVGGSTRATGRAGSVFDFRITSTDQSFNYKLRATWMTGSVIRATARLLQLADGLSVDQTRSLVREAEAVEGFKILVEIDPSEGSGVLPLEWTALLGPRPLGSGGPSVRGRIVPALAKVRALTGTFRRDYSYEAFWLVFPATTEEGKALFLAENAEAELVIRIYNKEGRVRWPAALVLGSEPRTGAR